MMISPNLRVQVSAGVVRTPLGFPFCSAISIDPTRWQMPSRLHQGLHSPACAGCAWRVGKDWLRKFSHNAQQIRLLQNAPPAIDMSRRRVASACHGVPLRKRPMDFFMNLVDERVKNPTARYERSAP